MKSIEKSLTKRLSLIISALIIAILIITDIAVDSWIEDQFDKSMFEKIGFLETLVNEDVNGVEFEFAGEFMPEFEGTANPEYFQLWYNGEVFERSDTLRLHTQSSLLFKSLPLDTFHLEDVELPDGRSGRIAYIHFMPQIDTSDRAAYFHQAGDVQRKTMTLAYAVSTEELKHSLWLIDGSFVLALIIVPLVIRFTVRNTVTYALQPLNEINAQISSLNLSNDNLILHFDNPVLELQPVVTGLNRFMAENSRLYEQQKRLTSDIAHELKTPVTELTTLSEIALRFPGDEEFERAFKPEVLAIAQRMKSIITSILTMHKYSYQQLDCTETLNVKTLLEQSINTLEPGRIRLLWDEGMKFTLCSNQFALESVFNNLLINALQHSRPLSTVLCSIERLDADTMQIVFSNMPASSISEQDLAYLFDPLWQKDPARTSTENFGLGLSIVSVLLKAINGRIKVSLVEDLITFRVLLPT